MPDYIAKKTRVFLDFSIICEVDCRAGRWSS